MGKLKIGLLGCGGITGVHSASFLTLCKEFEIEIAAFADLVPEKRTAMGKKFPTANQYEQAMAMLEGEPLDAVDICLPTYLHAGHAVAAMNRGMHVFVEKPVCLKRSEVNKLLEAEQKNGVKVMVGQVVRFFDEYRFLKSIYDSQEYGKLKSLFLQRLSGGGAPEREKDINKITWFREPEKSGTAVLDFHIHDVDFIRSLLGEPKSVSVSSDIGENRQPSHITALYHYNDELVFAEGGTGHAKGYGFLNGYRANFEDATLVYNNREKPSVTLYKNGEVINPEVPAERRYYTASGAEFTPGAGPYYEELRYFIECVIEDKPIKIASLADALKTFDLTMTELEMVYKQAGVEFPIKDSEG